MRKVILTMIVVLLGNLLFSAEPAAFLRLVADIPLPGKTTRFDYMSLNASTGRLYFSHMGDGTLVVFDTKAEKVITNMPGFPMMTGIIEIPSLRKVYGSVTAKHEIAVVDTEKLTVIRRIPDGKFPDGLAYAPEVGKVFVSDESGEAETVIDARTDRKVNTIAMGGEVGNTQYDPNSHLIYACVQTGDEFVAIDPAGEKIVARYHLQRGHYPHGFYIDAERNRAYIACQGDAKLIVFNLKSHEEEDSLPIGDDPDVLAYDTAARRLYVACETGVVSIFKSEKKLTKLGDQKVGPHCHTVAVDPSTHRVYFPLKDVDGVPVLRIMKPDME